VEFIDLPGNGEFHYLDSPLHLEDYIEFVRLNSHFVKSNKKVNIIALSFGAMVAYHWSLKYTSEIASLILINTSFRPSPFYRRIRPSFFYRFFRILTSKNTYLREKEILKLTTHLLDQRIDTIAETWGTRTQLKGTSLINALKQIYVASQAGRSRVVPTIKTLLLCSERDELVHFRCSQEMAQDWKIPLEIHFSAGHDLTLDDPQWVIEKIKQFLISSSPT